MKFDLRSWLLVALCIPASAWAQAPVDEALVGEWRAPIGMGLYMTLRIEAKGRCIIEDEVGTCRTEKDRLVYQGPEAGRQAYRYRLQGDALTLSGGDLDEPVKFTRAGGRARPAAAPPPQTAQAPRRVQPEPDPEPPSAPVKPAPEGAAVHNKDWGVRFTPPAGWSFQSHQGALVGAHDSEAGLMVVRFERGGTEAEAQAEFAKGLREGAMTLHPAGTLTRWSRGKAKGLRGEMTGTVQGGPARAALVAVQSPHGGFLLVMGITTPEKMPNLGARVEQLAGSATFEKPPEVKAGSLAGSYWFFHISPDGQYSREAKLFLCSDGTFWRDGEMHGSQTDHFTAGVARQDRGTWKAEGSLAQGTLIVSVNGATTTWAYRASTDAKDRSAAGQAVFFGNDKYQKTARDCR
jgi:hypothetical protein